MKRGPSDWVLALLPSRSNTFTPAETVKEGKREGKVIVYVINRVALEGLCFLYADLKVTGTITQYQGELVQVQ